MGENMATTKTIYFFTNRPKVRTAKNFRDYVFINSNLYVNRDGKRENVAFFGWEPSVIEFFKNQTDEGYIWCKAEVDFDFKTMKYPRIHSIEYVEDHHDINKFWEESDPDPEPPKKYIHDNANTPLD